MLTNGNYFFTAIFAVESFVKLAAMSPRFFFAVSQYHIMTSHVACRHCPSVVFPFPLRSLPVSYSHKLYPKHRPVQSDILSLFFHL